jgi:hypothetical protein
MVSIHVGMDSSCIDALVRPKSTDFGHLRSGLPLFRFKISVSCLASFLAAPQTKHSKHGAKASDSEGSNEGRYEEGREEKRHEEGSDEEGGYEKRNEEGGDGGEEGGGWERLRCEDGWGEEGIILKH